MINEIIINKTQIIEKTLKRVNETYNNNPKHLKDYDKQDVIVLNLQRACQAVIDISMYICKDKKLGIPQHSSNAIANLSENDIIPEKLATNLKHMVGFRNIAVHDYQSLNLAILKTIIEEDLSDFKDFATIVLSFYDKND